MTDTPLVYSTDTGRRCPKCERPVAHCNCGKKSKAKPVSQAYPKDGVVRVRRETKGRKGKTVTAVHGLPLDGDELKSFAKTLKSRCGTGGTVKDGVVEIQGDHRDALAAEIRKAGYTVKFAGG